ncbi:hypothetical protein DC58_04490 [Vibrio navarrensis]|uniref:hypothetical protein n=1 Tax=Vibrio navarrensis TaxID=29495 RepID=UPI00052D0324|nr:hypothetical protein [Vibrio navarrensis]KGK15080.1 hypothetical protein DC58_04490 [Vibrio navarrensis]
MKKILLSVVLLAGCVSTGAEVDEVPLENVSNAYDIQGSADDLFSASQECLIDILGSVPRDSYDFLDEERRRFSIRVKFTQTFPSFGNSGIHESTFSVRVKEDNKLEVSERNIVQWDNFFGAWAKVSKGSDAEMLINARAEKFANCVRLNK